MTLISTAENSEPGPGAPEWAVRIERPSIAGTMRHLLFEGPPPATPAAARPGTVFAAVLQDARRETLLMAPAAWDGAQAAAGSELAPLFREARARGVSLRAVLEGGRQPSCCLGAIDDSWEVRGVPLVPMCAAIVDGATLVENFAAGDGDATPALRVTHDPAEVQHAIGLFERLWNEGTPQRVGGEGAGCRPRRPIEQWTVVRSAEAQ